MRELMLALLLLIVTSAVVAVTLTFAGVPKDFVPPLSTSIIGCVPLLHKIISKYYRNKLPSDQVKIMSLNSFGTPFGKIIIYGATVLLGTFAFSNSLTSLGERMSDDYLRHPIGMMMLFGLVINLPVSFLIGRWVGRVSINNGILAVLLIAFLAKLIGASIDYIFISEAEFKELFYWIDKRVWFILLQISGGTAIFCVVGLIGYWRGRLERLPYYLNYLLHSIPESSRVALVDMAYDEASKVKAAKSLSLPLEPYLYEHSDAGLRAMWTNKQLRAVSAGILLAVSVAIGAYFLLKPSATARMAALAEGLDCDQAVITGHVFPNGSETFAWFEWGETPALGRETLKQRFTKDAAYHAYLASLKENTTYYFKAVAENIYGRRGFEVRTFKTHHCGDLTRK